MSIAYKVEIKISEHEVNEEFHAPIPGRDLYTGMYINPAVLEDETKLCEIIKQNIKAFHDKLLN